MPERPVTKSSAGVVITNPNRSGFILQRKDDAIQVPDWNGRVGIFGGSLEGSETPRQGLLREFSEEFPNSRVRELLTANIAFFRSINLPRTSKPEDYEQAVFVAQLKPAEFKECRELMLDRSSVAEGTAVYLRRSELQFLLRFPTAFFGYHDRIFEQFFEES